MTTRAKDLKHLGELIALCLNDENYRPSLTRDAEMADAFDHAMKSMGRPNRAWRGAAISPEAICRCGHAGKFHRPAPYGTPCFMFCGCDIFRSKTGRAATLEARTAALLARVADRTVAS